jgi:hypothetical protein
VESNVIDEDQEIISQFNLADVPSTIEADDPVDQDDVLQAIFTDVGRGDHALRTYHNMDVTNVKLSTLANQYNIRNSAGSLNLLQRRGRVIVDDATCIPTESPNILWSAANHFLDYLLVVPMGSGMDACLSNTIVDHNYLLDLDLRQPFRQFNAKYGKLGFSPEGRFLYIGRRGADEVWLSMCPKRTNRGNDDDYMLSSKTGNTCMTPSHSKMLIMFVVYLISTISNKSVDLIKRYGSDLTTLDGWKVEETTTLL